MVGEVLGAGRIRYEPGFFQQVEDIIDTSLKAGGRFTVSPEIAGQLRWVYSENPSQTLLRQACSGYTDSYLDDIHISMLLGCHPSVNTLALLN